MEQVIYQGIKNLLNVYEELKPKRIMLVCDSAYKYLSEKIRNVVENDKYKYVVFDQFTSNPLYEQVFNGVKLFNDSNCDVLVAIGGGSTIDVAKCIKLYCKMDNKINYLEQEKIDTKIPLIAIPTTAGTGSESTRHAVIYYNDVKQSISHSSIVPNYVILESNSLKTLPQYQKKCTMLDALCQAIESWWSISSTDESIDYSKKAITLIKNNWEQYIFNNDSNAANDIMLAANYSGKAINITATTAAHAMSYKITSLFGLPHGHAVAICMPKVWESIISNVDKCSDERGKEYLLNTLDSINKYMDLSYYKNMLVRLEITSPISNNYEKDIDLLTQSVNPVRLKNNPVILGNDALKQMYKRIVKNEN